MTYSLARQCALLNEIPRGIKQSPFQRSARALGSLTSLKTENQEYNSTSHPGSQGTACISPRGPEPCMQWCQEGKQILWVLLTRVGVRGRGARLLHAISMLFKMDKHLLCTKPSSEGTALMALDTLQRSSEDLCCTSPAPCFQAKSRLFRTCNVYQKPGRWHFSGILSSRKALGKHRPELI